ncbi:MAG: 2,3-bisphosphoglycerate-independent phosphoglycerate mutase [Candidatus Delongbacteria bacterium]|nr:2,3-bisphosphoglycerate-independent phosphoglycerate mutase [Candidatus Delongbacteria bacterium]
MDEKKVILCIMDGFGIGKDYDHNAVTRADKPKIDELFKKFPSSQLICSGFDVGLPEGTMGNSEVGHLNIGAGRIVFQDIGRIHKSIKDGDFAQNPPFMELLNNTASRGTALHIMGLVSDGDVHSSIIHLKEIIRAASEKGLEKVYIHAFTDGRDTPPESGIEFIREIEEFAEEHSASIASVSGRYYAMDRDKRWDRIQKAYDCLTKPSGSTQDISAVQIVEDSYKSGITDEFIVPAQVIKSGKPVALIEKGDSAVFFNFRSDRARELSIALNRLEEVPFDTEDLDIDFVTMTQYREDFPFRILFEKPHLKNILGEVISNKGLKQLRIAETEKYAHVTFFFNGGDEKKFEGEERILIPSPKVPTYDMQPEMSAFEVAGTVVEKISEKIFDLIVINFANCDMVGHTGVFKAAVKAVETVDACVGKIYEKAVENGYTMLITADHGNAEFMLDGDVPFTAHTKNKVPFLVTDKKLKLKDGKLGDIAPTILRIMDIGIPDEMTGDCLIVSRESL